MDLIDGYYWARDIILETGWMIVEYASSEKMLYLMGRWDNDLSAYEFGDRIETPEKYKDE